MTVKSIARGYCGDQNAWVFHICLLPVRSENDSCRNLSAAAGRWISAGRMLLRWGKRPDPGRESLWENSRPGISSDPPEMMGS